MLCWSVTLLHRSLLFAGPELLVAVRAMNDKLIFSLVLDETGGHELLHHIFGQLTGLGIFLKLHDLLLQSVDLIVFGSIFQLFVQLSLLVGLDLLLSPSAFAGGLQHVRRNSLGLYNNKHEG